MTKLGILYWSFMFLGLFIILQSRNIEIPVQTEAQQYTQEQEYKFRYLQYYIAERYNIQLHESKLIIEEALKQSNSSTFPTVYDTLAVISIESAFKTDAVSTANAKGLMQILYKPTTTDISLNISDGVYLLKDYYVRLDSEEAAIHAYNVGIGAYKRGKRNTNYVNNFFKERNNLQENT